ncbi:hypothetical protein JL722_9343 [Aureococcus anophagefferens]|nr:hypothetical protein JL722_9343 [Aureococcus anophagefferens]
MADVARGDERIHNGSVLRFSRQDPPGAIHDHFRFMQLATPWHADEAKRRPQWRTFRPNSYSNGELRPPRSFAASGYKKVLVVVKHTPYEAYTQLRLQGKAPKALRWERLLDRHESHRACVEELCAIARREAHERCGACAKSSDERRSYGALCFAKADNMEDLVPRF